MKIIQFENSKKWFRFVVASYLLASIEACVLRIIYQYLIYYVDLIVCLKN